MIAVEPQPTCIKELSARFTGDDRVTVEPVALGAEEGSASLFLREFSGLASLIENWEGRGRHRDAVEVVVSTLDRLIAAHGRPKLLKLTLKAMSCR